MHLSICQPAWQVSFHRAKILSVNFALPLDFPLGDNYSTDYKDWVFIIRSQEKNLNQNRDSNLGPPDF